MAWFEWRRSASILLFATLMAGCRGAAATRPSTPAPIAPSSPKAQENLSAIAEPCPGLDPIAQLLLQYYVVNHHFPAKLEELKTVADPGDVVSLTCPVSGQPFQYVPGGLRAPGREKQLLVYESVPAHHGLRWGIFMIPSPNRQPPQLFVDPLDEQAYRTYLDSVRKPHTP